MHTEHYLTRAFIDIRNSVSKRATTFFRVNEKDGSIPAEWDRIRFSCNCLQ